MPLLRSYCKFFDTDLYTHAIFALNLRWQRIIHVFFFFAFSAAANAFEEIRPQLGRK